jgi:hypothetical protein
MKIFLHPHSSPALVEVRDNGTPHVEIWVWDGGHPIPLDEWKFYRDQRQVPHATADQVKMLAELRCTMQKDSPLHWTCLYVDHTGPRPTWLYRLQHAVGSRATQLDGVPTREINDALRNARQALGLERGPGAPRQRKP